MIDTKSIAAIFDSLKGHPRELVAISVIVCATILALRGVDLRFAGGVPAGLYVLYLFSVAMHEWRLERLATLNLERLERTEGASVRDKARKAIGKRKGAGNGKP